MLVAAGLFLFAVQLLGAATGALAPVLRAALERFVAGDLQALGVSWVAAYLLANGTVVAATALSLFDADLILASQLYLMVVGSRLGAAAIVVIIGAFDYVHEDLGSLRESTSLGLLTFVLTHSIYLPVLVVGYVALQVFQSAPTVAPRTMASPLAIPEAFSLAPNLVIGWFGAGLAFVFAVALLVASLRLFDRFLASLDQERLRRRYVSRLGNRWVAFALGVLVTGATTSVAFSLGVVVPLYNRDHLSRGEVIPYVLGANVGTLVDTLVVALALATPTGVLTVLLVMGLGLLATGIALLLVYPQYRAAVDALQDWILADPVVFLAFLLSLLVVPLLLVVW